MLKVGYQGVPGAYSEMAVLKYFKGEVETIPYKGFKELIMEVERGHLDYGMLPVENSTTGIVAKSTDLIKNYDIYVLGEEYIKVEHNLIVLPDTNLEDIKEVYSHPEALKQCDNFFENNPKIKSIAYIDTAKSVDYIKKEKCNYKGAIASTRAAEIYGLKIIKPNLQDIKHNTTRFLVISNNNEIINDANKISLYLVTSHTPGALFEAIKVFADNKVNMVKIESRPILDKSFEYCFYIDIEGNVNSSKIKKTIKELKEHCNELKILGNYKKGKKPC